MKGSRSDSSPGGVDAHVVRVKVLDSKDVGYILAEDTLHLWRRYLSGA